MNNTKTFSFKRIALLMKKSLYERKSNLIRGFAVLFGLFAIIYIISQRAHAFPTLVLKVLFFSGLYIMGILVAGLAFPNLRTKEKTISYLSLPASHFEKFLAEFLLTTICFVVAYVALFYLFNILVVWGSQLYDINAELLNIDNLLKNSDKKISEIIFTFFIFQIIFFIGAITFKKAPPMKTAFFLFIAGAALSVYLGVLAKILIGSNVIGPNNFFEDYTWAKIGKYGFYYALTPILWIVAFLKIKEKEA